uniref:Transforming growth factor, alpha n=1 Tax=Neolamprologus brichardi TaxID=32507 RepID=A0A3Q4HUH2_NEOBR
NIRHLVFIWRGMEAAFLTPTLCLISTEFVAAAVRSHFDDCPDSHRHFCFHGTCRFLILEETPACVCHPGFIGMRCEHADLLAVVATNHRQQTIATVLVLCVIGCVLIMVQECRRRSHAHHYVTEKHGVSCCPSESGN